MLRTRVGYAGGTQDAPTYRRIGDHTEAIQIEFDPSVIAYGALLDVFWANHSPFSTSWSTQYKAVLWTHGPEQARLAKASAAALAKKAGEAPKTEIRPATRFWIAEDYHQKYYLRGRKALLAALFDGEPEDRVIRDSELTARVNGWVAGHGTKAQIASESDRLGLRKAARQALEKALGRRAPVLCR